MVLEAVRPSWDNDSEPLDWLDDTRVVIHPLLFCPPLKKAARYCLVKRDGIGRRTVLGSGLALNSHEPLNLAVLRQRAAKLGANEVLVLERLPSLLSAPWCDEDALV